MASVSMPTRRPTQSRPRFAAGCGAMASAIAFAPGRRHSFLERPILQLGVVSYCLPIVAIGPLMMILFLGDTPKVVLAALSVFFTTLIGTVTGLRTCRSDDA